MKTLGTFINEKLLINKNYKNSIPMATPENSNELINIIQEYIKNNINNPSTRKNPLNLNFIDTSKITDLSALFRKASIYGYKFEYIDISCWDISNVETMAYMFAGCTDLIYVEMPVLSTVTNLSNVQRMFYDCKKLEKIDLSRLNTSNVTSLSFMFLNCSKLQSVGDISNWNISNVTNLNGMFEGCKKLQSVGDISQWDVSNVLNFNSMFKQCEKLEKLNIDDWTVSKILTREQTKLFFSGTTGQTIPQWMRKLPAF